MNGGKSQVKVRKGGETLSENVGGTAEEDQKALAALLRADAAEDIAVWNDHRTGGGRVSIPRGTQLSHRFLEKADFRGAVLEDVDFASARMRGADFTDAVAKVQD